MSLNFNPLNTTTVVNIPLNIASNTNGDLERNIHLVSANVLGRMSETENDPFTRKRKRPSDESESPPFPGSCREYKQPRVNQLIDPINTPITPTGGVESYFPESYSRKIDALLKSGKKTEALNCFSEMKVNGIEPDVITYTSIIGGLINLKSVDAAFNYFNEMKINGIEPNEITYNSIISGLIKLKLLDDALSYFDEMKRSGIEPNVITYTSIISFLLKSGKKTEALSYFYEMKRNGIKPNEITYTSIIGGHINLGLLDEALSYFDEMKRNGIEPNEITYNSIIRGLYNSERTDEALNYFIEMKRNGIKPKEFVYGFIQNIYISIIKDSICSGNIYKAVRLSMEACKMVLPAIKKRGKKELIDTLIKCFVLNEQYVKAFELFHNHFSVGDFITRFEGNVIIDLRGYSKESALVILTTIMNTNPGIGAHILLKGEPQRSNPESEVAQIQLFLLNYYDKDEAFTAALDPLNTGCIVVNRMEAERDEELRIIEMIKQPHISIDTIERSISDYSTQRGNQPSARLYASLIQRYIDSGIQMAAVRAYRKIKKLQWRGHNFIAASLIQNLIPELKKHGMNREIEDLQGEHDGFITALIKREGADQAKTNLLGRESFSTNAFEEVIYYYLSKDDVETAHQLLFRLKSLGKRASCAFENELLMYHVRKKSTRYVKEVMSGMDRRGVPFYYDWRNVAEEYINSTKP